MRGAPASQSASCPEKAMFQLETASVEITATSAPIAATLRAFMAVSERHGREQGDAATAAAIVISRIDGFPVRR
jgi:hypothetical protein